MDAYVKNVSMQMVSLPSLLYTQISNSLLLDHSGAMYFVCGCYSVFYVANGVGPWLFLHWTSQWQGMWRKTRST